MTKEKVQNKKKKKKKKKKRKGATVQREHSFNKRYFFSFRSKEENVTR